MVRFLDACQFSSGGAADNEEDTSIFCECGRIPESHYHADGDDGGSIDDMTGGATEKEKETVPNWLQGVSSKRFTGSAAVSMTAWIGGSQLWESDVDVARAASEGSAITPRYRAINSDCSIVRVSDSRRSIHREKQSLFDIISADINTSL
jgi:hypothetical protein